MSRQILQDIIDHFQVEKFTRFFRAKNDTFRHPNQPLPYEDSNFVDGKKLEEIRFEDGDLIVCSFGIIQALSERSGKRAQYELGKRVLKETQKDAGIFIFYDQSGNFRFSLIYAHYSGRRRDWSAFRRFTYFVSKELTNKTFLQRIGDADFSSLARIKEAFEVEPVTREFYEAIANWYFWAVKHCRFPKGAEAEENGRYVSVIRLITRMIFIWFMRERDLVPKALFEEEKIQEMLKETALESSSYYRAILQNLFFATLSTKKEERRFRDEKRFNRGWNKDFGNQYVFRYQKLFKHPEKIKDYFGDIPFLNGGLFECLDDGGKNIYIDGFTERKKYQPQVPNFLFFSDEQKADLNVDYGTKNKSYKVLGLLNILSSYNFTIDENSPDDADIALDPELLGRVFENLLASFNPETSTTARKATGSYYTPREIVNYMVTESLKAYFKTHLPETKEIDEKLEKLFSTNSEENPFTDQESKKLVELIENVRIVDPAVGSGAFPMGALNKMVFILNKIDPGNELWKQAQLKAAEAIPDPQVQRSTKKQIEAFFKEKNADYGRKLYLIQKCIYGVDIQQIAVEIAKLRFFISLLVDEKIDKNRENWGIEPLPNLDFKIMQGNSLISEFLGIDFDDGQAKQEQAGMFTEKEDALIKEFEQKKNEFQNEPDRDKKARLKKEVEDLMIKIFEAKVREQKAEYFSQMEEIEKKYALLPDRKKRGEMIAQEKKKLSERTGFDLEYVENKLLEFTSKNKTKPFFAWKLYFAEVFAQKGGFDIVIANPPYLEARSPEFSKQMKEDAQSGARTRWGSDSKYITRGADLLIYFLELAIYLIAPKGTVIFITQNSWLNTDYGKKFQNFLLNHTNVKALVDSDFKYFDRKFGPNINTVISIFVGKEINLSDSITFARYHQNFEKAIHSTLSDKLALSSDIEVKRIKYKDPILRKLKWGIILSSSYDALSIFPLIEKSGQRLDQLSNYKLSIGQGLNVAKSLIVKKEILNEFPFLKNMLIPFMRTEDGAPFVLKETKGFLIDGSRLQREEIIKLKKTGIDIFRSSSTNKITPILIMPRGISRHYCAANEVSAYSSSGVDIYDNRGNLPEEMKLNLWLFLNSSIAWLLREITGRKSLGGGLLKAEATDLKEIPLYFEFRRSKQIRNIYKKLKEREAMPTIEEINTSEHRQIDEIVFDYLKIHPRKRTTVVHLLKSDILGRMTKSKT